MDSKYNFEEPEQLDALDELIISELGQQQRLRAMMQQWDRQMQLDQRRRAQRRLRLVPIVSNILSVAALMTVGFVLQSLVPGLRASSQTSADDLLPVIKSTVSSPPSTPSEVPLTIPTDSAAAQ